MRSTRTWLAAAVVLAFLVPSAASAQSAGLTLDLLKNATYPDVVGAGGKSITLHDGRFEQRTQISNAGVTLNLLTTVTFIDAAIGSEYAAVIIASNGGGSGTFLSLHLVTSSAGVPTAGPGLFIGDRTRVESFTLEGDRVRLGLLTAGPTDPLCCPTQRETREYIRDGNTFRLTATTITQPGSGPNTPPPAGSGAVTPPKTGNLGLADPRPSPAALLAIATFILTLGARSRTRTR